MFEQYGIVLYQPQVEPSPLFPLFQPEELAQQYGMRLLRFVSPLARELQEQIDIRPVRTLVQALEAMVAFRDRTQGLLLSEWGDYLDGLGGGGGGTKRLGTLIRHRGWKARQIDEFLLCRGDGQLERWQHQGEDGLLLWDGTELEKPESLAAEGLCAVRSGKAGRLTRVKKGYYHSPGAPIFVPGIHGTGLVLVGRRASLGAPMLVGLRWWTSRGPLASFQGDENCKLLRQISQRWGRQVVHVFDRGYASSRWLGLLRAFSARFLLRWKTEYHLVDAAGVKQAAWKIARGKRGLAPRTVYDAVNHCNVEGSVLWFPVTHPDFPDWPLTLVVGRRKGGKPWYLLTNEPVENADDAWKIVMAYARRWRIEMTYRQLKSDMAIQSLRVYEWETRLKLLGLVSLAYAFLMEALAEDRPHEREALLDYACHRTGSRLRAVDLPFSRFRLALSKLWLTYPCWFVRRAPLRL